MLEQLVAQQGALFATISSVSGWHAGMHPPFGFNANCEVGDSADLPSPQVHPDHAKVHRQDAGTLCAPHVSHEASFLLADVGGGVDPEVFTRSQLYFASAGDHRKAFEDVASNLQRIPAGAHCSLRAKDAVVDVDVFKDQV